MGHIELEDTITEIRNRVWGLRFIFLKNIWCMLKENWKFYKRDGHNNWLINYDFNIAGCRILSILPK